MEENFEFKFDVTDVVGWTEEHEYDDIRDYYQSYFCPFKGEFGSRISKVIFFSESILSDLDDRKLTALQLALLDNERKRYMTIKLVTHGYWLLGDLAKRPDLIDSDRFSLSLKEMGKGSFGLLEDECYAKDCDSADKPLKGEIQTIVMKMLKTLDDQLRLFSQLDCLDWFK